MRHYEIVLLIHPDQSDQVLGMVDRYKKLITEDKGVIHRFEDWGRRQLTYPINKVHKAHYVLLNVECGQTILNELTSILRFNDAVLRHIVLSKPAAITELSLMMQERRVESESERN